MLAGITVALVVIPQSLAYAQLAGMPAYYGLYASLLPSIVGALFGSSAQLSTGPVALTSLLTAASIAPLAPPGSDAFIAHAVLLALLSGLFQIGFGLLRMGMAINLLSQPVLMGFINAAAIIIALSQLPPLAGLTILDAENVSRDPPVAKAVSNPNAARVDSRPPLATPPLTPGQVARQVQHTKLDSAPPGKPPRPGVSTKPSGDNAPGGTMVYATCTLLAAENQAVAEAVAEGRGLLASDDARAPSVAVGRAPGDCYRSRRNRRRWDSLAT